jgi:ferredoxin
MSVDINLDPDLCIGSGTCMRVGAGVFAGDGDEIATIQGAGAAIIEKVRCRQRVRAMTIAEGDARV